MLTPCKMAYEDLMICMNSHTSKTVRLASMAAVSRLAHTALNGTFPWAGSTKFTAQPKPRCEVTPPQCEK